MGASESRDIKIYNKNGKSVLFILEYTHQKKGPVEVKKWLQDGSPMLVKVDEYQWPSWHWMPVTYGVGTGFPDLIFTIICGTNYIRLNISKDLSQLTYESSIKGVVMFIYEDGLRVGLEPKGWFFGRGTERRTLHPWKPVKSCVTVRAVGSSQSCTDYVLDEKENNVYVV